MNNHKDINSLTDIELITAYRQSGDNRFAGALFMRYSRFAFGVSMKYLKDEEEAKDAAMQVFEKLPADLKKHDITNFKGWLHTVVRNHCLMKIRGDRSQLEQKKELIEDARQVMELNLFSHPYKDEEPDREDTLQFLEEGITLLKQEQRKCIELFYLEEKCYNEVSEITGYAIGEVKSYIQNGKRNLKNFINEKRQTSKHY